MKIDIENITNEVVINRLKVGDTFSARRTETDEIGYYMIVDKNSGAFLKTTSIIAVNLSTGQIRKFTNVARVTSENLKVIKEN